MINCSTIFRMLTYELYLQHLNNIANSYEIFTTFKTAYIQNFHPKVQQKSLFLGSTLRRVNYDSPGICINIFEGKWT